MATSPSSAFMTPLITSRPSRDNGNIYTATVLSNTSISANLRRIALRAPEFTELQLTGPDEFFGLFMPQPGQSYEPLAPFRGGNIRAHTSTMKEKVRPNLRWYTIRHFNQHEGVVEFDVATHGITKEMLTTSDIVVGPGLHWALTAAPGSRVGFFTAHGLWQNDRENQLLVADASAAPSVWAILEFQQALHPSNLKNMHVIIVAQNADDVEPDRWNRDNSEWSAELGSYNIVTAPLKQQAEAIIEFMHSARSENPHLSTVQYVWVSGEQALAKGVRTIVVNDWGVNSKDVFFCPYWIAGQPRP